MQVDDFPSIDPNTDYTQILPIQQKRTVAFINHFVMNTVSFLNTFAQSCESRLMEFEYKLQKVEASLCILESQLASISGLNDDEPIKSEENKTKIVEPPTTEAINVELPEIQHEEPKNSVQQQQDKQPSPPPEQKGPIASEDSRFRKFFKMVQFGVPPPAVKIKMQAEGVDPNILDTPNLIIPGFEALEEIHQSDDASSTDS